MNTGTLITVLILTVIVVLALRSIKRRGLSAACGSDCAHCGQSCKTLQYRLEQARRDLKNDKEAQ